MIELKLLSIATCGGLYFIGGAFWHNARRFILPVFMAVILCILLRSLWVGFTILPCIGILCCGYGMKSPFRKTLTDAGARGMYLFLTCLTIGLAMLITGHLGWLLLFCYCVGAGILGGVFRNLPIYFGDHLFGAWIGTIVLIVK